MIGGSFWPMLIDGVDSQYVKGTPRLPWGYDCTIQLSVARANKRAHKSLRKLDAIHPSTPAEPIADSRRAFGRIVVHVS
jgi:hypothetical protein